MALFSKKKSVVWRDTNGRICCPGEKCKQKICDNNCPIHLNTQAAAMLQRGKTDHALAVFEQMIKMAPDYYDPWNSSGTIYSEKGKYQKAYDCYMKAHEIASERSDPIHGLALACKDLKRYEECLQWCDEYDKLESDHRTDEIREFAQQQINKSRFPSISTNPYTNFDIKSNLDLIWDLMKDGVKLGYVQEPLRFVNIPELICPAEEVYTVLLEKFSAFENDPSYTRQSLMNACLSFSFYSGYGAVALWQEDWPKYEERGIIPSLSAKYGFDHMDKYVMDYCGPEYNSDEEKKLRDHLQEETSKMVKLVCFTSEDDVNDQFKECMKTMFYYGMIIQIFRLGLQKDPE